MSDCTGLFVSWVEPLTTFFHVIVLGIATGGISLFLTKSTLLNGLHDWLENNFPSVEKLLSCPWCTNHWVAAILLLIYQPLLLNWGWRPVWMYESWVNYLLTPVDWLVTLMVIVTVATVVARWVYSAVKSLTV